MAESTLSITFAQLQRHVGRFLGFDRNPANWTTTELQDVQDAIDSGTRMFYSPPPLQGERMGHRWSWLRPTLTLSIVQGTTDYALPDLFGGLVETLAYDPANNVPYRYLKFTGLSELLQKRQLSENTWTAPPEFFAIYPVELNDGTFGELGPNRYKITFYPTPDNSYTLTGPYYLNPYALDSSTHSYPLGGQPHSETLIAACCAAADIELNQTQGVQMQKFLMLLAGSVGFDRGVAGPHYFGYNRDHSSNRWDRFERQPTGSGIVTYDGVDWS